MLIVLFVSSMARLLRSTPPTARSHNKCKDCFTFTPCLQSNERITDHESFDVLQLYLPFTAAWWSAYSSGNFLCGGWRCGDSGLGARRFSFAELALLQRARY